MPSYNRVAEYGVAIFGSVCVVLLALHNGNSLGLVFAKAAACPLFYLANRGVTLTFVSEASKTPWTFPYLERLGLHALMWGCMWIIVLWHEEMSLRQAFMWFAFFFIGGIVVFITVGGRRDSGRR